MEWKKIKKHTKYSINKNGEVRNDVTKKIKKPYTNKDSGYLTVDLYENNKTHKITIHRLLAETFIPNPENKPCVDHKDGDRKNNKLSNLRWATYSENNSRFNTVGVRSERIKVTHYKEIRKKRGGGHIAWDGIDFIKYYERIKDVADDFKCTQGNITPLLKSGNIGVRGRMRGYKFEYVKKSFEGVTTIENTLDNK